MQRAIASPRVRWPCYSMQLRQICASPTMNSASFKITFVDLGKIVPDPKRPLVWQPFRLEIDTFANEPPFRLLYATMSCYR